jgi:outer membrane protein TolC
MQAINAASTYKSALERYEVINDDLELAQSIKETTRTKFNAGLASSNDLTQAESQYLTTLGNYINTSIELLNAKLDLVTAYGK